MLEARGIVVAVEDGLALVEPRHGGCGQCSGRGGCGGQKLGELLCREPRRFRVRNPLAAQVGDEVQIALPDGVLWRSAWRLYVLPLAGLFAGGLLASQWTDSVAERDGLAALGALLGLAVGLLRARHASRKERGMAVIAAVLPPAALAASEPRTISRS